jgi:hypothetical protein
MSISFTLDTFKNNYVTIIPAYKLNSATTTPYIVARIIQNDGNKLLGDLEFSNYDDYLEFVEKNIINTTK